MLFETGMCYNENGVFTYDVKNSMIDEAVIKAAEIIKETIRKENPNACTYDVCTFIAQKTADFFKSQQLK